MKYQVKVYVLGKIIKQGFYKLGYNLYDTVGFDEDGIEIIVADFSNGISYLLDSIGDEQCPDCGCRLPMVEEQETF